MLAVGIVTWFSEKHDAYLGAGLEAGIYDSPTGYAGCVAANDAVRIHEPGSKRHGSLTGSALTMNQGVGQPPSVRKWSLPLWEGFLGRTTRRGQVR